MGTDWFAGLVLCALSLTSGTYLHTRSFSLPIFFRSNSWPMATTATTLVVDIQLSSALPLIGMPGRTSPTAKSICGCPSRRTDTMAPVCQFFTSICSWIVAFVRASTRRASAKLPLASTGICSDPEAFSGVGEAASAAAVADEAAA